MQTRFSDLEYAGKKKPTRRDRFLAQLAPYYPAGKGPGRLPLGLARMLRRDAAQQRFGLFDAGIADTLHDRPGHPPLR
ncbi:MAG TPA: IS5 family transposase, partial [Candidatus Acidoferrales bacterium]|nr:IS5 family transposase [Candidatus Acidoferrales bacterium]